MNDRNPQALQLGNAPSESSAIEVYSRKASAACAAKMLDFAREMLLISEDLSERQADYWIFELSAYPAHVIERAWHAWVRQSKFMPTPSELIKILERICEADNLERRLREDEANIAEGRAIREKLKAAGEPYGAEQYHAIMRAALERIRGIPAPPDPNRRRTLQERIAQAQAEREHRKPPAAAAGADAARGATG